MKRIAVLTSGGDSPAMNAAIRAVVRIGIENEVQVFGVHRGFNGLINGEIFEMDRHSVSDIIQRGGTILRTARSEEFRTPEGRQKALNVIKVLKIDGIIVIGGDGSFRGAKELSDLGIPTVGIPGTIDNDLPYTDYTVGFDTALNTAIDAINKIRDTSSSHERVSVIEVMGRNCGDLALFSGIAGGAEQVIVPEKKFTIEDICENIFKGKRNGKLHNIIILAEGVGGAQKLAKSIEEITGIETRATVLGYIQRGGSPSAFDRILASRMGSKAVKVLLEGKTARLIGIKANKIIDIDIKEALDLKSCFNGELYKLSVDLSN
ncbi:6-phosphofructokinase [Clostridium sp. UBA4395]|uniref:6-phosphofructokinase n=1 Tax=Clostridium sp. UBA4395 TaxID=1946360 RepID=UPI0032172793